MKFVKETLVQSYRFELVQTLILNPVSNYLVKNEPKLNFQIIRNRLIKKINENVT